MNQGSSDYQTDTPEGMANGIVYSNVVIFCKVIQLLLHSKVAKAEILDEWLSQWMTRANLLYRNLRNYNEIWKVDTCACFGVFAY